MFWVGGSAIPRREKTSKSLTGLWPTVDHLARIWIKRALPFVCCFSACGDFLLAEIPLKLCSFLGTWENIMSKLSPLPLPHPYSPGREELWWGQYQEERMRFTRAPRQNSAWGKKKEQGLAGLTLPQGRRDHGQLPAFFPLQVQVGTQEDRKWGLLIRARKQTHRGYIFSQPPLPVCWAFLSSSAQALVERPRKNTNSSDKLPFCLTFPHVIPSAHILAPYHSWSTKNAPASLYLPTQSLPGVSPPPFFMNLFFPYSQPHWPSCHKVIPTSTGGHNKLPLNFHLWRCSFVLC